MRRWIAVTAAVGIAVSTAAWAAVSSGRSGGQGRPAARLAVALFAQLRGTKEVGTGGPRAAGDRDGRGSFSALITASSSRGVRTRAV